MDAGITVTAVMTDNDSCFRPRTSPLRRDQFTPRVTPHRPTGEVGHFNRTLAAECTYPTTYISE